MICVIGIGLLILALPFLNKEQNLFQVWEMKLAKGAVHEAGKAFRL